MSGVELPAEIARPIVYGVHVRRAVAEDLQPLLALLAQMHDDPRGGDDDAPDVADGIHARAAEAFCEILGCRSRAILVAELGGALVGTLDLFLMANLTRAARPWAGVENFVVDERSRRRGIGGALLDVAMSLARDAGCYKIQLISHVRRDAAHALYERAGFNASVRGYRHYFDPDAPA